MSNKPVLDYDQKILNQAEGHFDILSVKTYGDHFDIQSVKTYGGHFDILSVKTYGDHFQNGINSTYYVIVLLMIKLAKILMN